MDHEPFDALTRLFATRGSRRRALVAIIAAGVLRAAPAEVLAGRRHRRHKGGSGHLVPGAEAGSCSSPTHCQPGPGRTNAGCDFSGSTTLRGRDVHGAIFANSNFTRADLSGADLRGAVLNGACLVDADLTGAVIDNSTVLAGAIACRTTMPNGTINNAGCNQGTSCCPTEGGLGSGGATPCVAVFDRPGCRYQGGALVCPGGNLRGYQLSGCNLSGANLRGANLREAKLTDAKLTGADLTKADLSTAKLNRADLTRATLSDADLTRADLTDAWLLFANLQAADVTGVIWNGTICPDGFRVESPNTCCGRLDGAIPRAGC